MKKVYLAAFALFAVIASSAGDALALIQWHCVANPPGVPSDQHHGWGFSQPEAAARALQDCSAAHDGITCELGPCVIEHHP